MVCDRFQDRQRRPGRYLEIRGCRYGYGELTQRCLGQVVSIRVMMRRRERAETMSKSAAIRIETRLIQGVLVVSIAYRVSPLGSLAHPELSAKSGGHGLWPHTQACGSLPGES